MKVIFLDIDGVLNSHHWYLVNQQPDTDLPIDPRAAFNLKFIAEKVDVKIVISSARRLQFTVDQFNEMFRNLGLAADLVIGATPTTASFEALVPRIAEIDMWREEHKIPWKNCAIIDDCSVAPNCEGSKWLPKDPTWPRQVVKIDQRDGLTYSKACEALDLLAGPRNWKRPVILI